MRQSFLCIALAATSAATFAAGALPAQRAESHAAFVAITVADLDATVRWYEAFLGARRVSASRAPSGIAEHATVANEYLMAELIHFVAKAPSDTALRDVHAVGLQKAGMWVERAVFDSTLAHLRRMNATFVGGVFTDSSIKARSFIVRDNSGVYLQFFTSIP